MQILGPNAPPPPAGFTYGSAGAGGYPQGGYPPPPQQGGYPPPPQQGGYPQQPGYPQPGFSQPGGGFPGQGIFAAQAAGMGAYEPEYKSDGIAFSDKTIRQAFIR